jgi:hypothetical protein
VANDEIEFEVEFGPRDGWSDSRGGENAASVEGGTRETPSLGDADVYHFHLRCFEAWQLERHTPEPNAGAGGNGVETAASGEALVPPGRP